MRRWICRFIGFSAILLLLVSITAGAAEAGAPRYATVPSFVPDALGGDDGLPASPDLPLRYGPIGIPVDSAGDAVDAHEGQYLAYFAGHYYWYGTEYGCGTHIDLTDDAPFCGFATYESADLTHWRLVDRYETPQLHSVCATYCAYPKVVYSRPLHRYLFVFSSDNGGNIGSAQPSSHWLAESDSPAGPWHRLRQPQSWRDEPDGYSLATDQRGRTYLFSLIASSGSVTAEQLNADGTGSIGPRQVVAADPSFVRGGLAGVFRQGRYWYLLLSTKAKFYGSATLVYLRATSPLGPWTEQSPLSADTCGGTGQGVSVLPTPAGSVPVLMIDLYRSSPGDASPDLPASEIHGDWNQAIAGRDWTPLHVTAAHTIAPIRCTAGTRIPLAHPVPRRRSAPVIAQPDCRITAHNYAEQTWTTSTGANSLRVPVFQRAYVTDPRFPARVQPPTRVDGDLSVRLISPAGTQNWRFASTDISWAPNAVTLHLRHPIPARTRITLQLRTRAMNGCYGDLVTPRRSGRYAAVENGVTKPAAAELLIGMRN